MIKDIMVALEGTAADEVRLAAVEIIAGMFQSNVIGLFLHTVPYIVAVDGQSIGATRIEELREAKALGDRIEDELAERLARLNRPTELRRIDVLAQDAARTASREARSADTFMALRPDGGPREPERLVESVLFGSGRHLFLVPDGKPPNARLKHILVAWNGSRESARALAEAIPYLHKAKEITILVVDEGPPAEEQALTGTDLLNHLQHHGIEAFLHRAKPRDGSVGVTLMAEAERREADLLVMGGYGHSRLREYLLGGVTYDLLHQSPLPLLIAH